MAGIELKIIDEAGNTLPPNTVGEILVKAPGMMRGYWNNPEATRSAIVDGWYHSGDGGRLDEEGYLYIADRIKDMIISGGENIYPTEVENALLSHPAVAEAAVLGVPDEKWGEAVSAIIVLAPGQTVTDAELIDYLRAHLAGFKIPRRYRVVDSIPRTPTGKVQKFKLKDL
jgi:acyl-CoA synthetase (AMP-forming)/AMP-acid ligase II